MFRIFKNLKRFLFLVFLLSVTFVVVNFSAFWKMVNFYLQQRYPSLNKLEEIIKNLNQIQEKEEDEEIKTEMILHIKKIGVKAPIIQSNGEDEASLKQALERGVVLLSQTALPGTKGNTVILGHSSDYIWHKGNYKAVFALLGKLQRDDLITIKKENKELTYKVINKKIVSKENQEIFKQTESKELTLSTPWPLGMNLKRLVVQAELMQ